MKDEKRLQGHANYIFKSGSFQINILGQNKFGIFILSKGSLYEKAKDKFGCKNHLTRNTALISTLLGGDTTQCILDVLAVEIY